MTGWNLNVGKIRQRSAQIHPRDLIVVLIIDLDALAVIPEHNSIIRGEFDKWIARFHIVV